jgi:hypothetical protein
MIKRKNSHEELHPGDRYEGIKHDAKGDFHGPDDEADKDHDGKLDKKPGIGKDKD